MKARAPDFTLVKYTFTYPDAQAAEEAFAKVADKKRRVSPSGATTYSPGRQLGAREEKNAGTVVTFLGQIRTSRLQDPWVKDAEDAIAGPSGSMEKILS